MRVFFFRNDITLDRPSEKQIKGGRGGMYISFSFVFAPSLLEWFFPYLVYWLQIIKKKILHEFTSNSCVTHVEKRSLLIIIEVSPEQKEYHVGNFIRSIMCSFRANFNKVSRLIWDSIGFAFFALWLPQKHRAILPTDHMQNQN